MKCHWHRGIILLTEEWEHCDEEYERFLLQIAQRAGLMRAGCETAQDRQRHLRRRYARTDHPDPRRPGDGRRDAETGHLASERPRRIAARRDHGRLAREDTDGDASHHEGARDNLLPRGPVRYGEGDIASDRDLIRALGARVVAAPKESVPLDVLWLPSNDEGEVTNAAMRFRESFVRVARSKPGGVQLDYLREAAQRAYREQLPVTISSVSRSLQAVYAEYRRRPDAVTSTFNDLTSWRLFEPRLAPADFFRQSWIIDVHEAPETAQRFIVFLILDALYAFSKSLPDSAIDKRGNRELRLTVGIDEARKVLGYGQPSLISLVRESRSKGVSIFLISQSPDDYDQEEDNFLENVGLALCFKTNAASARSLKALLGQQVDLGSLPAGVAVTRLPEHAG